jgi:hypothetical protein
MAEAGNGENKCDALKLAEEAKIRRYKAAAAIAGGAAAVAAAGWVGARAMAKRNGAEEGRPVNPVLQAAITATECKSAPIPRDTSDPDPEIGLDGS